MEFSKLVKHPVIAAVKGEAEFEKALKSRCAIIFMLKGNICNVAATVEKAKQSGKQIYLHIDLLDGFGKDEYALRFIKENIMPDGVITTKHNLVKISKQIGLDVVFRIFTIDDMSYQTGINIVNQTEPNVIEIMPALMPTVIKRLSAKIKVPIIAGGLVTEPDEVSQCIDAGAKGVSTSCEALWNRIK